MSGLYLHIPYCRKRCTYCDFHFSTTFDSYRAQLQSALVRELEIRAQSQQMPIQTIYFGGGTPSLLHEAELAQLFKTIRRHYIVADACETRVPYGKPTQARAKQYVANKMTH